MLNRVTLCCLLFCLLFSVADVSAQSDTKEKPAEVKPTETKPSAAISGLPADSGEEKDPKQIAKEDDIRKLLVLTGAGKLGVQVMKQMTGAMQAENPNVPAQYFNKLVEGVDPNELIEIVIPAYDNHMTHEDIKQLLKFYDSPIGKKLIRKQPLIVQDSMIAGQKWGAELNRRLRERLEQDF